MKLGASVTLTVGDKIKYLRTFLCGKALHEFETLCNQVVNIIIMHLNKILLGLGTYFFLLMPCLRFVLMSHIMRKPRKLNVKCYAAHMGEVN